MGVYGFEPQTPPTRRSALNQLRVLCQQLINVLSAFLSLDSVFFSACLSFGSVLFSIDQRPWNPSFGILASPFVMPSHSVFKVTGRTDIKGINRVRI